MFILDRYIARQFLTALVFAILVLLVIFTIVHIVENIDFYIDAGASFSQVVRLYLNFMPDTIMKVLPFAILLGTLFSVGGLSRNNELVAMRAAGISLGRTAMPLFGLGVVLSVGTLVFGETVVPAANQNYSDIRKFEIEQKRRERRTIRYHLYRQGDDGRIFRFERYDIPNRRGYGVLVQAFEGPQLAYSIRADEMRWLDSAWLLQRGEWRTFLSEDTARVEPFDSLEITRWKETPEYFAQRRRQVENMNFVELAERVRVKEKSGEDATAERFGLQLKLAYPFTCFMMVLLGVPIASTPKRAGLAKSLMITVGMVILYRALQEVMRAIGNWGDVPPIVAAWTMNVLFLAVGIALFAAVRK